MKHIAKFYSWLEINENTPIETKLLVLDSCAFSALIYGCEGWGDISCVTSKLLAIEIKMLKTILKVKKGTTNNIIFFELRRSNIITKIKDKQYHFFQKLLNLPENISIMKNVIDLCRGSSILDYYNSLHGNNCINFMHELDEKICTGDSAMIKYYRNFVAPIKSCIYNTFTNDYHRLIITRWRLSNHKLRIETGRYERPYVPREERLCKLCHVLEDENHVIFNCPIFDCIRVKFSRFLSINNTVNKILNPKYELIKVARYL